jgi:hypothetical protein
LQKETRIYVGGVHPISQLGSDKAGFSSTGFSLWGLVHTRIKIHRLKPVLLKPAHLHLIESIWDKVSLCGFGIAAEALQ